MPGTGDGSSLQNAKEWDHSLYPGGTRVYDSFTNYYSGPGHWWAVELKGGVQYTFQTRLPTAFTTILYLYNAAGSYIAYGYFNGDDAPHLSKIVYTIPSSGIYYLVVYGYYYSDYGPYVLESVPAPVSTRIVNTGGSRFDARRLYEGIVPSRFDVFKETTATAFASRFLVRALDGNANQSRIETRQIASTAWPSRFDYIKTPNGVLSVARFDARRFGERISISRNDVRKGQTSRIIARHDIRQVFEAINLARYEWHKLIEAGPSPARHDAMVKTGWAIYARDAATSVETLLGFIPEDADPKALFDVPLPDGVWEIEARPSQYFWNECRGRKIVTLVAGTVGGGETTTGLPVIQNLRREIVAFQSVIKWKVTEEYAPGVFDFGLWFSPTSPVDTSGPPDQTVAYVAGQGDYQAVRAQTASEYVAVAAFTATERGEVAELFMPWSTTAPPSPSDQYAYRSLR
ncbi:MAG: hypothetical protein AB7F75_00720 [Planctomycetota bacterium]